MLFALTDCIDSTWRARLRAWSPIRSSDLSTKAACTVTSKLRGILHRPRQQPSQPGGVLRIELAVARDHGSGPLEIQTIDGLQCLAQQVLRELAEMNGIARRGADRPARIRDDDACDLLGLVTDPLELPHHLRHRDDDAQVGADGARRAISVSCSRSISWS